MIKKRLKDFTGKKGFHQVILSIEVSILGFLDLKRNVWMISHTSDNFEAKTL